MTTLKQPLLWLSDARGVYIPRDFAASFADRAQSVSKVDDETWAVLEAGPDHEWYWEAWETCMNDAIVSMDGVKYFVYQDNDVWLVPVGMEFDDEQGFYWPTVH